MSPSAADPLHVVILGGGSAGWMTAALFAHHWRAHLVRITVVESPDIGIIGVGEGSTPQLKAFFDTLGIAESDWMPACDATYKLGIGFEGWSLADGYRRYFHPFPGPLDVHTEGDFFRNAALRRSGVDVEANPDSFYLAPRVAARGGGPHGGETFPFDLGYGYHFDAHKLGAYLRGHAVGQGAEHLSRTVERVEIAANGDVAALILDGGERLEGDFFIDCSGFRAMIAQQALGARFLPFAENLFNDRAVVAPTAHPATGPVVTATRSIAMSAGWRWSIPLTTRVGNGYVYSSRYLDRDAAEAELRAALGLGDADAPLRHLDMKVGRLATSWTANCLAMGLAQGFIEPLEATALHIVIATIQEFLAAYEGGNFTARHRDMFNARIGARYDGIRDYIVAHYRMNRRGGSGYWHDASTMDALSDNLKTLITAWFTGADLGEAIDDLGVGGYYPNLSWHCLFAGYGTFPAATALRAPVAADRAANGDQIERFLARAAANFSSPGGPTA